MDREGPNTASDPATGGVRGRVVVAAEVLGLLLMLLASAGTCALLIAAHRRAAPEPTPPTEEGGGSRPWWDPKRWLPARDSVTQGGPVTNPGGSDR